MPSEVLAVTSVVIGQLHNSNILQHTTIQFEIMNMAAKLVKRTFHNIPGMSQASV